MLKKKKSLIAVFALVLTVISAAAADVSVAQLVNSGRADEAIRALNGKNSAESYNQLCRVYYALEDWDNAVRNCEKAVDTNPNVAEYHLWLGRSYGEKADRAGALSAFGLARKTVASFQKAVQIDPKDWRARRDLAEYYATAPAIVGGGRDKALKLADEISGSDPANAAWIRGLVATKDKNYYEAETQYKAAIASSGSSASTYIDLARLYRSQGRWNDFDDSIRKALATSKKSQEDLFDIGELLVDVNRNLPTAVGTLQKYLSGPMSEYGPAYRAHLLIGQAFEKQGDRNSAGNEYRAALSLASNYRPAQEALRKLNV